MASRIKCITIEIGGDTTGLDKALKSVNSSIAHTQSALKDINKLLKLDPANTELLTQKQKLLKDAISSTKEKLDALKQAQAAESLVGKNAMSGFLALMNAAPADIEKLSGTIDNCDGTAEKMAATMQDNLMGQLTILKSQLEELAISFGEMLMPTIRSIVTKIQEFVDKLNGMDEGTRQMVLKVGLLVAALGPFLVILGTTISKIGTAMKGFVQLANGFSKLKVAVQGGTGLFGKLGAALGGISAPVVAVVAVIGTLVAAFLHLWNTNEGFREAIIGTWNTIKETVSTFCQGIVDRLNALGFSFQNITEVLSAVWNGFCSLLAPVFEGAFQAIAVVLSTVLNVITGILDVFIGLFTGNWSQMWTGIQTIFSGVWEPHRLMSHQQSTVQARTFWEL